MTRWFLAALLPCCLANASYGQALQSIVADTHQSGGGAPAGPWVLKAHTFSNTDFPAMQTPDVDCTGANAMFVVISRYTGGGSLSAPTDTSSNVYTQVGTEQAASSATGVSLWQSFGAATSASFHWASSGSTEQFSASQAACFSDGSTSSVDQSAAAAANTAGSITPTVNNELVVHGFVTSASDSGAPSIGGGFTVTDSQAFNAGHFVGGGMAYLIQTTAAASNPTWSTSGGGVGATKQASFK